SLTVPRGILSVTVLVPLSASIFNGRGSLHRGGGEGRGTNGRRGLGPGGRSAQTGGVNNSDSRTPAAMRWHMVIPGASRESGNRPGAVREDAETGDEVSPRRCPRRGDTGFASGAVLEDAGAEIAGPLLLTGGDGPAGLLPGVRAARRVGRVAAVVRAAAGRRAQLADHLGEAGVVVAVVVVVGAD